MCAVFFRRAINRANVVVGNMRVTKGWMCPGLCEMSGSHTWLQLVWIYRMRNLDVRDAELQGKGHFHILPGYCSGKWSHSDKFASITLIQTLRNGQVPFLSSLPIVNVTVTGRMLFLLEGQILKRRVLTVDPGKEIYDHHLSSPVNDSD